MNRKIVYVADRAADWVGIYVDDEIYFQGHKVPTAVWLDILDADDYEYELEENGNFPDNLSVLNLP